MAAFPPPTDNFPIFDALAFSIPLTATITEAEANAKYLARTDIATSVAQTTSFTDNITIGNSLLDYIPAQGLQIRPTVNSESVFLRVLDGTGTTKQRIECNATHQHLYDITRLTDSATPANFTTLQQTPGGILILDNTTNSSTTYLRNRTSGGLVRTPITLTSAGPLLRGEANIAGLNGIQMEGAVFGRNDTDANTFNGTLGYSRYPIGWTISVSKAVAIPTSNVVVDVISTGTPITAFNALSNGVWRISCSCNNNSGLGAMTYAIMSWGTPTGASIINGTTSQLLHQTTAGLSNMGLPYPDLILRTTGNGTTAIVCNFQATYSVQPTITFNIWATKIA